MPWSDGEAGDGLRSTRGASPAGLSAGEGGQRRPGRRGPLAAALRLARPVDLLALSAVPAGLVAAFRLPEPVRRDLALSYVDPTPLAAFASHFVHLDVAHLATNVAVYALVAPVAFLLCALAGRRREFYVAFAAFLLAFPLVLSALNVALVRPHVGYGFSGVNTAFFGFLPIALTWYLSSGLGVPVRTHDAPALFFASTTLVAVLAVPASLPSLAIAVVGVVATGAYLRECLPRVATLRRALGAAREARPGYVEVGVFGAGAVALFPLVAFPADPAGAGTVVNIYGHLLGYALGFIASYVTFGLVGLDPSP